MTARRFFKRWVVHTFRQVLECGSPLPLFPNPQFFTKACTLLLFAFTLLTLPLCASDLSTDFDAANKLYEQGHYSEAVTAYDKLLSIGPVSESVYFNRGNAYFKLGQIGRAIASYRQAQRLAPRDRDVLANLQFARTRARGGAPYHADRWRSTLASLTLNEWTLLTCVALWVLFTLLALNQWRSDLKPRLHNLVLGAGIAAVCFGICLFVSLNMDYLTPSAIVTVGEADVRNGPLEESPSIFKVRDGAELEVLDTKDGWLQVLDPAQRVGWIKENQVQTLDFGLKRST